MNRTRVLSCTLIAATSLAIAAQAQPGPGGRLVGRVVHGETGQPLGFANVVVVGTTRGMMALQDGRFELHNVPPGTHEVQASFIGFDPQILRDVVVAEGEVVELQFELVPGVVKQTPVVMVVGDPTKVDPTDTQVSHVNTPGEFLGLPVDDVIDVIARTPGVSVNNGEMNVRGARSGGVSTRIDGVVADNPLGGPAVDLGMLSVAQSEIITGGMAAEYGNANSAIINISTRSGGRRFEGNFRYQTDDYGRADKTFTNYDRYSLGLGGPTPFAGLTYYVSGEATFQDGEFLTTKRYKEHEFLGGAITWKERASNQLRTQGRLDWHTGPNLTMTAEMTLSHVTSDPYTHNWNSEGYVSKVLQYPRIRNNRFRPGMFVVQGNVTVFDGPWRQRAASAPYVDIREQPDCVHCLLPQSDNTVMRAVRVVDVQGRGSNPAEPALYAMIDFVMFEGYQTPTSDWVPELTGDAADSSKHYFNAADRVTTFENSSNQVKWSMTHRLQDHTFYDIRVSRLAFRSVATVAGKTPGEFDTAGRFVWIPGRGPQRAGNRAFYTDPDVPYFVTAYDFPIYSRRNTVTWLVRADLTSKRWNGHHLKSGIMMTYNDLDNADFTAPGEQRFFGQAYGQGRNTFHTFNPEGSFYVQDRWRYEGMVVNAGVRYDYFSPGAGVQVELNNDEVERHVDRWQSQWSPRLGVAFPFTDRDTFHFHYGRFIQFPQKRYLFASQDVNSAIGGLIGNPNLKPETSVSYQAGVKRQFTNNVAGQVAVFNRDAYDLISSIVVTDDSTGQTPTRYVNRAYGSSRGLEISLKKAFSNHFAFDLSYTYSFADGVASNAEFGQRAAGLSYIPNGELPLDWDQRHVLYTTLTVAQPGSWSGTVLYEYGSGLPWTPVQRFEKRQDPLLENSRRLPATHTVDFRGEKFFRIHGRTLRLFFDGRNLLNQAQVANINPAVQPGMENATYAYREYATEAGRYGGAYLRDTDGDGTDEYFAVNDPRVFAPRRLFRVGLGFEF